MGSFAKQKGKRGEREAVKFLQPHIDDVYKAAGITDDNIPKLFRNQNQSFEGGYDIDGLSWLALEIKRQETLCINQWWDQTISQASQGQYPVLMFKQNRQKWRFMTYGAIHVGGNKMHIARVELSQDDFITWFKLRLEEELLREDLRNHLGVDK